MDIKSGGPALQDGAEGTSTNENNILSNTTQDQSQGKGSNGQLPETELGKIVFDITGAFTKHLSLQLEQPKRWRCGWSLRTRSMKPSFHRVWCSPRPFPSAASRQHWK